MIEIGFCLPWPPQELSPNARPNRFKKARIAKRYKSDCYFIALVYLRGKRFVRHKHPRYPEGRINIHLVFFPPCSRNYDEDNLVARFKSGLDGIRDAVKIDDHFFHVTHDMGDRIVPGGRILVSMEVDDSGK